jgi:hypothetical protein
MSKFKYIFSILIYGLVFGSVADASGDEHSAGFTMSNISGYGVYYDLYRSESLVVRPSTFLFMTDRGLGSDPYTRVNYELGVESQFHFLKHRSDSIFFVIGAYYYHDEETKGDENFGGRLESYELESFSAGFGFGIERRFDNLVLSAHAGFKAYDDNKVIEGEDELDQNEHVFEIKEGGGISVGFFL